MLVLLPVAAQGVTPMVVGGAGHTVALKNDGTVLAFGSDGFGQLGRGRAVQSAAPVQAQGLSGVTAISGGAGFSLAVRADGTVWAWGRNEFGQLGDGSQTSSSVPARIRGITGVQRAAAGVGHALLLKTDGTVWGLGNDDQGQLGTGTGLQPLGRLLPIQVRGLTDVVAIAAGFKHSVALRRDGTVWTWGDNTFGQLGYATQSSCGATACSEVPAQVAGLANVIAIDAGWNHTVAVRSDGTVWAWGWNNFGQLGDGSTASRASPVQVTGLSGARSVAAGLRHTIAIKSDGTVWAWGGNNYGQLGNGSTIDRLSPVQVTGLSGVDTVSAAEGHSVARTSDGTLWAWGFNGFGQLGDASARMRSTPVRMLGLGSVTAISASLANTAALRADGTVWTWGSDGYGQLGIPTVTGYTVPAAVPSLTGVTKITAGYGQVVALRSDGTVWGTGVHLWANQASNNASLSAPGPIAGLAGVAAISSGYSHTLALKSDGSVWAWGWNGYGQLGDGTANDAAAPLQVAGLSGVTAIAAGWNYSVAAKADGTIWAWGQNDWGQLGSNSTQRCDNVVSTNSQCSRSIQQAVSLTGVTALAAGLDHTLALRTDRTVWGWGNNSAGQLGNGARIAASAPVRVTGLSDVVAVSASFRFSLALKSDGTVWAWGTNRAGLLAGSTSQDSTVPVQVQGLSDVVSISAGFGSHAMAVRRDGTVWGWGGNSEGNIGDGTYSPRRTPVLVANPSATGPLDLAPDVANSIPADRIPALLVAASKTGGLSATTLSANVRGRLSAGAFASGTTEPGGRFAATLYNVYVAAYVPLLQTTTPWWQLDGNSAWGPLVWPMSQYLSGVALDSQTDQVRVDILLNADLSSLAGTVFYVGYGTDPDEMVRSGRYIDVYTVPQPQTQ